ncbi:MAG: hypothetical protein OES26_22425 [Gammaproteobacteria bacterium]|nr:hypothetical protein [Gammaproteobacteria bacterium]
MPALTFIRAECRKITIRLHDYILAQSVFTHLPQRLIQEFFENVGKIMHRESEFYFTYWLAKSEERIGIKDFAYPWALFTSLAADNGFQIEEVSESYTHPRGQRMGRIKAGYA